MLMAVAVAAWAVRAPLRWHQWQPRLHQAEAESTAAAARVAETLRQDLKAHAAGADRFAEQLLSWRAKWALAKSELPGGDPAALGDFVRRVFDENVLSGADIDAGLRRAAIEFEREQQGVMNRLLLDLRLDLDWPQTGLGEGPPASADKAERESASPAAWESGVYSVLRQDALAQTAILVGAELASVAAVQLAVSAGVLGTSGALAPETLGLSLVAGIVADLGLSRLYKVVAKPDAVIAARARRLVTDLADRTVDGAEGIPGVRARLEALAALENARRRAALRRYVLGWR